MEQSVVSSRTASANCSALTRPYASTGSAVTPSLAWQDNFRYSIVARAQDGAEDLRTLPFDARRARLEIRGLTTTGARYTAVVAASGDPGYAATAVMLGESALCLATDDLASPGGVLTPATAMAGTLRKRLRANGFTFDVRRS